MTHICVSKLAITGSDNGLPPDRRQAIIWTNAGLLLIEPLGTNFSEMLIEILTFSFKKMRLIVSSAKRRPFCFGLNVLTVGQHTCSSTWTYLYAKQSAATSKQPKTNVVHSRTHVKKTLIKHATKLLISALTFVVNFLCDIFSFALKCDDGEVGEIDTFWSWRVLQRNKGNRPQTWRN